MCVILTRVAPLSGEASHTTEVSFHSFLSLIQCRLQSVTCHTTFLPGTTSLILKSTKVSPKRTVKASPTFSAAPVNALVHATNLTGRYNRGPIGHRAATSPDSVRLSENAARGLHRTPAHGLGETATASGARRGQKIRFPWQ